MSEILNDNAYKFVCRLFNEYQFTGTQWEVDAQMDSYYNFIKSKENEKGKEFDYEKTFNLLDVYYKKDKRKNKNNKYPLPEKKEVFEYLKKCTIFDTSVNGQLVVFLCYSLAEDNQTKVFQQIHTFTVDNSESSKDVKFYQYDLKDRYEVVERKIYPSGSTVIGEMKTGYTVYYPPVGDTCKKERIVEVA